MSNKILATIFIAALVILGSFGYLGYALMHQPLQHSFGDSGIPATFGTPTNSSASCGASTSTVAIQNSGVRNFMAMTNDSSNTIYVCFGPTCSASTGIRLNALGGAYEMEYSQIYVGKVSCIASGSTSTLTYIVNQ